MTAPGQVDPGVRQVLTAPRGHRFTRTRTGTRAPARPPTREQRLLAQMADNPRVRYRMEHGALPHWMEVAAQQRARRRQAGRVARAANSTRSAHTAAPRPRSVPERDPFPRRPRSHRKPRRAPWRVAAYALVAVAGAIAHHLIAAPL